MTGFSLTSHNYHVMELVRMRSFHSLLARLPGVVMATKVIKGDFGQNLPGLKRQGESSDSRNSMSGSSNANSTNKGSTDPRDKWIFTRRQLENTPSTKDDILPEKQLQYRHQAANLIQDMGQKLPVNQLTINTAIVYMHRFYMFRSFKQFSRYVMAPTSLFLAAKVEEQPRKLEHVIKVCQACLYPDKPHIDTSSEMYLKKSAEIVQNELILLETLGFEISIDHPHTYVVKCTQLVKASRELSQMAYFMATNSLHLTTFCLLYKPAIVSAMCIHLSCKWSNYEIPLSSDGKRYWSYIDNTITEPLLEKIITEFLQILQRYPARLCKIRNYKPNQSSKGGATPTTSSPKYPPVTKSHGHSKAPPAQLSQSSSHHPPKQAPPPASEPKKPGMSLAEYKQREKIKPVTGLNKSTPEVIKPSTSKQRESIGWPTAAPNNHKPTDKVKTKPHNNKSEIYPKTKPLTNPESAEKLLENKITAQMSQKPSIPPHTKLPLPPNHKAPNGGPVKHKDHHGRHSLPANSTAGHGDGKSSSINIPMNEPCTTKLLHDVGKRHPDVLVRKLKEKSQTVKLTQEEAHAYVKAKKRIEEERKKREKREHEKKKKAQQQQQALHNMSVDSAKQVAASGTSGNLKFSLKLPPAVRAEMSHSTAHGQSSTASSGSGSEQSPGQKSRKRAHGQDISSQPEATVAKQSRKSEGHHKNSEHRHKHKHRNKHSKSSTQSITDDTFQKALNDAISNQGGSGSSGAGGPTRPTATLKGTVNGQADDAHNKNSKMKEHFDPSVPVSATLPDDLFEENHGNISRVSSPETGEIVDDDEQEWPQSFLNSSNNNAAQRYTSSNMVSKQQERIPPLTIKSSQIHR